MSRSPVPHRPLAPALCGVLALAVGAGVGAHEYRSGAIEIDHPQAPAPPPGAPGLAGYLTLANTGDEPDRLLGATAAFAAAVELHATTMDGDVARMRRLDDGIALPPGATVALVPNATHLMFVDPVPGIVVGDALPVTLEFERAGSVEVVFNVEDGVPAAPMDHEGMDHGGAKPGGTDRDGMDHGATDHEATDRGVAGAPEADR